MECNPTNPYSGKVQAANPIQENYVFIRGIAKVTVSNQKILAIAIKRFVEFKQKDGSPISLIRDKVRCMTSLNHGLRFARLVSENKKVSLEIHEFWLNFVEDAKIKFIHFNNKIGQFTITKLENYEAIVEKFFDKFLDVNEEDYAEEQGFDYEEEVRQYKDNASEIGGLKNACLHDQGFKEYQTKTKTGEIIKIEKRGNFSYGKLHGSGYKMIGDNDYQKGNFYYSNLHGKGLRELNGEKFEGEFWYGKFVSGIFTNKEGKEYKGSFKKGKLNNEGEELFNPKLHGIPISLIEITLEQKEQKSDKPKDSKSNKLSEFLRKFSSHGSKSSTDRK